MEIRAYRERPAASAAAKPGTRAGKGEGIATRADKVTADALWAYLVGTQPVA
jgi:hypothetical protein